MIASSLASPVSLSPQSGVARRQVGQLLDDAAWRGDVDGVLLALHEALINAHRHAGGVSGASACLDGGSLQIEVRDRGRGFAIPDSAEAPDPEAETGRGLFLIRRLSSAADVSRSGGEVRLLLRFDR
ncbi:MAG TPA: ATP-binding protein [Acidimicrobiales bacterium]|nr:ATP-binding protein [Acidimicrobiales bacterium]